MSASLPSQLVDLLPVRRLALARGGPGRAELPELGRISRAVRLLRAGARHVQLESGELALRILPVPVEVVPHHPDDRQEQEQAGRREDDVQEVDVVGVSDTLLFSHGQILKKNSGMATMYFKLNSHRNSILIGSAIIARNRNAVT